jgi:hypothetical protein
MKASKLALGFFLGWATLFVLGAGYDFFPNLVVGSNAVVCNDSTQLFGVNNGAGLGVGINADRQEIGSCSDASHSVIYAGSPPFGDDSATIELNGIASGTPDQSAEVHRINGTEFYRLDGDAVGHHLGTFAFRNGEVHAVRSPASAGTVAIAFSDYNVCVNTSTGATTANLPTAPDTGRTYTVSDCTGSGTANPITLTPAGGAHVDGFATFTIDRNFASWSGFYTGSLWKTTAYYPGPGVLP